VERKQKGEAQAERRTVFRGTALSGRDFAGIQQWIDRHRELPREVIAGAICRRFGWRQANGLWAVSACRLFLRRMANRGWLRLAPPRRPGNFVDHRQRPGPPPVVTEGFAVRQVEGPVVVRPITAAERPQWQQHLGSYHYLGACALIGESLCYVATVGGEWVALLGWAAAALRNTPRDRYLGWDRLTKERRLAWVVNNVRFLVLPWIRQPHLASRILAANLRRLSADWQVTHGHGVLLAETFVDTTRFRGTCYRASNWQYLGDTRGYSRCGATYRANGCPKAVFVYALHRHARQWLRTAARPVEAVVQEVRTMRLDVTQLPLEGAGGLFALLRGVADPRHRRGVRHPMEVVLAIAVCAMLSGAQSLAAIAQWAADLSREQLRQLGSRRPRGPSEPTLRRVLRQLDAATLDQQLGQWVAHHTRALQGAGLAIDGKTLRGSGAGTTKPVHLVSAVLHEAGVVLAQHRVPEKTNEITSVTPLFAALPITGAVVTGDAMFTQKDIATHIVEDKHADYLFTVKDNQPTLRQDIQHLGLGAFPPSARHAR
jgi:hypothetical protein